MESNDILSVNDKKKLNALFCSEDGEMFIKTIREMYENHLSLAQTMYLKLENPNEQIAVQVNQATGIKEILDFVDTVKREVKERKRKEAESSSEQ